MACLFSWDSWCVQKPGASVIINHPLESMFMKKIVVSAVLLLNVMGCAHEPIVDRKGVDEAAYQSDLVECRALAEAVDTPSAALEGGVVGAAIGGAVGAILGNSHDAGRGAGLGSIAGGGKGLTSAERRRQEVLYRCLKGRGYRVLG